MSVDKCTRTVGGVRIPHAVCVLHLRYVYTHARFPRCLHTYGCSLTGAEKWRRSDAIATLGDGVCTLTARPDGMPTRRDDLFIRGSEIGHIWVADTAKLCTDTARWRTYTVDSVTSREIA